MMRLIYSILIISWTLAVHAAEPEKPDSSAVQKTNYPAKKGWEHWVDLPGTLITLPLDLVFWGIERGLAYQERTYFIQKAADAFVWNDNRTGIFPAFNSQLGAGAIFFHQWPQNTTQLRAGGMVGPRWRHGVFLELGGLPLTQPTRGILTVDYQLRTDENFWGIGPSTLESDESNFSRLALRPTFRFIRPLIDHVELEIVIGAEYNRIAKGRDPDLPTTTEIYTPQTLAGLEGEPLMGLTGMHLRYDSRNHLGHTATGWKVSANAHLFHQFNGRAYRFYQLGLEAVRFIPLFYGRVLVVRLGAQIVEPLGDHRIPFYYLSEIGDEPTTMRGFERGRFRDRQQLSGGVEYRYPVWHLLDSLFFVNAGQVGRNLLEDLSTDHLEFSYGAGLRLWQPSGQVYRLLLSQSSDGFIVQLSLNSPF